MAHIFIGDRSKVSQEVLEKVKSLSDEFWVLAEFTVTRNVDWLIVRPMGTAPAVVILAEVKGVKGRLRGPTNSPWQQEASPGEWVEVDVSHAADVNYYFQAVNTVNALIEWLHNNAPAIGDGDPHPWSEIRVWPDLLLLSVTEVSHLLPVAPDNKFGMWFTDLDRWLAHVDAWRPRIGPPLAPRDVENLVNYLGLTPAAREAPLLAVPEPSLEVVALGADESQQRVQALEQRVQRLESIVASMARALSPAYTVGGGVL